MKTKYGRSGDEVEVVALAAVLSLFTIRCHNCRRRQSAIPLQYIWRDFTSQLPTAILPGLEGFEGCTMFFACLALPTLSVEVERVQVVRR